MGFDRRSRRSAKQLDLALLLLQGNVIGVPTLIPGTEEPTRWFRLPAGRGGEALQGMEASRSAKVPIPQGIGLHLHAPLVVSLGSEAFIAEVVLVDQESEAAALEHPRDREIGGVGPVAYAPGWNGVAEERVLVRLVRALTHVVLDNAPIQAEQV